MKNKKKSIKNIINKKYIKHLNFVHLSFVISFHNFKKNSFLFTYIFFES